MATSIQWRQSPMRTEVGFVGAEHARATAQRARILDAFREGRDAAWTPPASGPTAERVDAEKTSTLRMGRMSAADRSNLDTLSAPREQALALARLGRLDEAETQMRLARFLLSLSRMSPEGRAYARTMHEAAESYLSYQRRDYTDAYHRMVASLEATDRLAECWGDSEFIVCRRVDLGHNLMRVEMRRGDANAAMQRGALLLRSVCGAAAHEGRSALRVPGDSALDARVAMALVDLIIGTVAELVAPRSAREARALLSSLAWLPGQPTPSSPRAVQWLAVKDAALGDDPERFMRLALPFLRAGRGRNPTLWYAVALDLTRRFGASDVVAGSDALDEIVAELSTAPRVPASMRVARPVATTMLLADALQAFREGRETAWSAPALDVAQVQLAPPLGRLSLADQLALGTLAEPRERALALARQGKRDDADASMKVAGFLLSLGRFSREGQAYARTLHHAAESYLSFRRGDHSDARARMIAAIEATDELGRCWGVGQFIVCRRAHLVHNLMRVAAARGATSEAMQLGAHVVEYLDDAAPDEGALDAHVVEHFVNLVMETVAELLAALPTALAREALGASTLSPASDAQRGWRAWKWLSLESAALGGVPRRFLESAAPFLRAGRGTTPTLWYAAALDLMRACCALELEAARDAAEEIAAELRTASRVPACMRRACGGT